MRSVRRRRDEGVTIVLVSMMAAILFVFLALVIDTGFTRNRIEVNVLSADEAALAGATSLGDGGDAACEKAWAYVRATIDIDPIEITQLPTCSSLAGTCFATTERSTTATWSDTRFTFTHPVPDDTDLLDGQPANAAVDLLGCNRFGVTIRSTIENQIAGNSTPISSSAVAANPLTTAVFADAAVIALAPTGCNVVTASGNVTISVEGGAPDQPQIVIDSTGCSSGGKVLDAEGSSQISVFDENGDPGVIAMVALSGANADSAYELNDVPTHINVVPTAVASPVTRAPIDDRYNSEGTTIDSLIAAYGGTGQPPGFSRYSDVHDCNVQNSDPDVVVAAGSWWIDCEIDINGLVRFEGGSTLVFDTIPQVGAQGELLVGCSSNTCIDDPEPTTMFVRAGSSQINGGTRTVLQETFVYLDPSVDLDLNGGADLTWTAPDDPTSPFDDLMLWTETTNTLTLRGNVDLDVEGTFFAPNAALDVSGSASSVDIGAQLWTNTIDLGGSASITLTPPADRITVVPVQTAGSTSYLIR